MWHTKAHKTWCTKEAKSEGGQHLRIMSKIICILPECMKKIVQNYSTMEWKYVLVGPGLQRSPRRVIPLNHDSLI